MINNINNFQNRTTNSRQNFGGKTNFEVMDKKLAIAAKFDEAGLLERAFDIYSQSFNKLDRHIQQDAKTLTELEEKRRQGKVKTPPDKHVVGGKIADPTIIIQYSQLMQKLAANLSVQALIKGQEGDGEENIKIMQRMQGYVARTIKRAETCFAPAFLNPQYFAQYKSVLSSPFQPVARQVANGQMLYNVAPKARKSHSPKVLTHKTPDGFLSQEEVLKKREKLEKELQKLTAPDRKKETAFEKEFTNFARNPEYDEDLKTSVKIQDAFADYTALSLMAVNNHLNQLTPSRKVDTDNAQKVLDGTVEFLREVDPKQLHWDEEDFGFAHSHIKESLHRNQTPCEDAEIINNFMDAQNDQKSLSARKAHLDKLHKRPEYLAQAAMLDMHDELSKYAILLLKGNGTEKAQKSLHEIATSHPREEIRKFTQNISTN